MCPFDAKPPQLTFLYLPSQHNDGQLKEKPSSVIPHTSINRSVCGLFQQNFTFALTPQLFDMCSYDIDTFREFIQAEGFRFMFDVEDAELAKVLQDEEALFAFAMRFLRQVLFGEHSIPFKQGARERRIAERKEDWEKRRQHEIERFRERDPFSEDGG